MENSFNNSLKQGLNHLGDELLKMHRGPATAILNTVTGYPVELTDHEGNTALINPSGSLSINRPDGAGFSIGSDGISATFVPSNKTSFTVKGNPVDPGGYFGFNIGGPDEVREFEGIQGLPGQVLETNNETDAQIFLKNRLSKLKEKNPEYWSGLNF